MPSTTDSRIYWAAETDAETLVDRCMAKFVSYMDRLQQGGRTERASQLVSTYYGRGVDGSRKTNRIQAGGEQGEVVLHTHNAIRPLLTQVLSLVAGQRPGMKPVATNADGDDIAQAILADGLRGYYERTLDMAGTELDVVRGGLCASSWWLMQSWRPSLGNEVAADPDTGKIIREGDIELRSVPMWRAACDATAQRESDRKWVIFRYPANRHELAAEYPDTAEKILDFQSMAQSGGGDWGQRLLNQSDVTGLDSLLGDFLEDDGVWVYELRHIPTAALEKGRLVKFVSGDCVLFDSMAVGAGYPYDPSDLHAYEWTPERVIGSTQGHTGGFDLLALQEMFDVVTTSTATTANLYGHQHIWAPDPGGLNPTQIQGGPTVLGGAVKPEPLSFAALKPETLTYGEFLQTLMREGAALNDVVMGQPEKGMPAQAMALLRAQAVQYHQASQGAYVRLVERNTTGVLKLLQRFARTKRVAEIAGRAGSWELQTWQAPDIAGVKRFACEAVNPQTQTYEAHVAMMEAALAQGWLTKDEFLSAYTTGSLKTSLEASTLQLELISRNKDLMRQGIGLPPVDAAASQMAGDIVFTDDGEKHVRLIKCFPHWLAYKEYAAVLSSPVSLANPAVVAAVTGVLSESLRLWAAMSPDELAAMGGQPLPSQLAMGGTLPPMPGEESGTAPPMPGETDATSPTAPNQPPGSPPTKLPKPPEDPLSGGQQGASSLAIAAPAVQ